MLPFCGEIKMNNFWLFSRLFICMELVGVMGKGEWRQNVLASFHFAVISTPSKAQPNSSPFQVAFSLWFSSKFLILLSLYSSTRLYSSLAPNSLASTTHISLTFAYEKSWNPNLVSCSANTRLQADTTEWNSLPFHLFLALVEHYC